MRDGRALEQKINPTKAHSGDDLEYLRLNWAVSSSIYKFCKYLIEHRYELQAGTSSFLETDDINIKGRIDARKTTLLRNTSGHPTIVVYYSSKKSFATGPNYVLIWVLNLAHTYGRQWLSLLEKNIDVSEKDSRSNIRLAIGLLTDVHRISLIKEALLSYKLCARPSLHALIQAKSSSRKIYRLAYEAYTFLERIERNDPESIGGLLEETLIKPKEDYQILELAHAFCLANCISEKTSKPVIIKEISSKGNSVLLQIGDIVISWQTKTSNYTPPELEPSEKKLLELLELFKLRGFSERPDIVVHHIKTNVILALGEAKSFKEQPDAWRAPLRQALAQIIHYSRGYTKNSDELDALVARSSIILSFFPINSRPIDIPINGPTVFDVEDLLSGNINAWADRILAFI